MNNVQEGRSQQEVGERYGVANGGAPHPLMNQAQGVNNRRLGTSSTAMPPERSQRNPAQLDPAQPQPVRTRTGTTEEGGWGADGGGSHSGKGYNDGQSGAPLGEGRGVRQDIRRLLADSRRE